MVTDCRAPGRLQQRLHPLQSQTSQSKSMRKQLQMHMAEQSRRKQALKAA